MSREFSAVIPPGCLPDSAAADSPRAVAYLVDSHGEHREVVRAPPKIVIGRSGPSSPPSPCPCPMGALGEPPCAYEKQSKLGSSVASEAPERDEHHASAAQRSAMEGYSRASAFSISKLVTSDRAKSNLGLVMFVTAVEPTMLAYMEELSLDGESLSRRMRDTLLRFLALLVLLPLLSFVPLLLPLPSPEDGFLANWVFNLVTHPILNYVPARAQLELLSRTFEPRDRRHIAWIVTWAPLASPCVCLTNYMIANAFGVYPLPYAVLTGCIPGIVLSTCVARCLIPEELMTADVRRFMRFNLCSWLAWGMQFGVLLTWLIFFPKLTEMWQLLASFAVHGVLATSGWAMQLLGAWMELPRYLTTELKVLILFVAFLFTAAQVSKVRSSLVLFALLLQDAGKSMAIAMQMCQYLVWQYRMDHGDGDESGCWSCEALRGLWSFVWDRWSYAMALKDKLRWILQKPSTMTKQCLREHDISLADARLLDHFARFMVLFAMVELCEIVVPLLYICVLTLLHSDAFGQNRKYFFLFADHLQFADSLRGNAYALLIEGSVLLALQLILLRSVGLNLLLFTGIVLKMDFRYWTFALGACCVAWATVLISHSGHNLDQVQALFPAENPSRL